MLLTWVEGQPLKSDDIDPRALGALAVRIHRAAEGFSGERPAYDEALISRLAAELRRAIASQQIPAVCGEICLRELCAIGARIRTLKTESAQYGLIHADLNFGNILSTPHGLVPIDFSLSGFGCLAQELGMLQSNYPDAPSRAAVLDGARAAGAAISPDDAELFRALSILLFVSAQHDRFYQEEWFQERLRFWCSTVFTHLIPVDAP